MRVQTLFPTPLWQLSNPAHGKINPALSRALYAMRDADPEGVSISNKGGWHSPTALQEKAEFRPLFEWLMPQIMRLGQQLNVLPNVTYNLSAWGNINDPGASNAIHNHANAHFSGSYYITVSEHSGDIWFRDPRAAAIAIKPPMGTQTAATNSKVSFTPQPGEAYVFPGWLDHGVEENLGSEERVGIAFNVAILPKSEA